MKKCNVKPISDVKLVASSVVLKPLIKLDEYCLYVGLDVHKDTIAIAIAIAYPGRQEPEYRGEIANQPKKYR